MKKLLPFLAVSLVVSLVEAAGPAGGPLQRARQQGRRPNLERLKALDANKDGVISKDEFPGAPERFKALDRNADGKIDPTELRPLAIPGGRRTPAQRQHRVQPEPVKKPKVAIAKPKVALARPRVAAAREAAKAQRYMRRRAPAQPARTPAPAAVKREMAQIQAAFKLLASRPQLVRELVTKPEARKVLMQIHTALARARASRLRAAAPRPFLRRAPSGLRRYAPRARPRFGPRPSMRRGQPLGLRRYGGGPQGPMRPRRQPAAPRYRMRR